MILFFFFFHFISQQPFGLLQILFLHSIDSDEYFYECENNKKKKKKTFFIEKRLFIGLCCTYSKSATFLLSSCFCCNEHAFYTAAAIFRDTSFVIGV